MPIVPINQTNQNYQDVTETLRTQNSQIHDANGEFSARMKMADSVRREFKEKGNVSVDFLDHYAATHLEQNQADSPAGWDYAALRHAAQSQQEQQRRAQERSHLDQEGNWVIHVGAVLPDAVSLQNYLSLQIPAYKARLKQSGISDEKVDLNAQEVYQQTVQNNLTHSLMNEDWQTAQEVFEQNKSSFDESVQQKWIEKIRGSFVRCQAKELWQDALLYESGDEEKANQHALAKVQESDPLLRADIYQEINRLGKICLAQKAAKQADVFEQLAQADSTQGQQLLDTQAVLDKEQLSRCRQALVSSEEKATSAQEEWFVKNYFYADEQLLQKAFAKGWCNGRDYLRLEAAHNRRKSGQDVSQVRWLCRGMDVWMRRQGFNEQDISRASYAVLSGSTDIQQRVQIWNQIKTLLTC